VIRQYYRNTVRLSCLLAVLVLAATPLAVSGCAKTPHHHLGATLKPYTGPQSERLATVARLWVKQWGDTSVRQVVVVPTTLARAKSIFGPVIYHQGFRRSFALFGSGTFVTPISPGSSNKSHFIATEIDAASLRLRIVTQASQSWKTTPLGTAYSLQLK
jgi:hypothetical protein